MSLKKLTFAITQMITPWHTCDLQLDKLMEKLEGAAENALCWFRNNGMKMNSDKCHLLISGHKHRVLIANIGGEQIIEANKVKLLGIEIDSHLSRTICILFWERSRKN